MACGVHTACGDATFTSSSSFWESRLTAVPCVSVASKCTTRRCASGSGFELYAPSLRPFTSVTQISAWPLQVSAGAGPLQAKALSGGASARDCEDHPRLHLRQRCAAPVSNACCESLHWNGMSSCGHPLARSRTHVLAACLLQARYVNPPVSAVARTGGKRVLVEHMQGNKAWGFKTQHSDFLHGSTDFPRWAKAQEPFRVHKPHDRRVGRQLLVSSK